MIIQQTMAGVFRVYHISSMINHAHNKTHQIHRQTTAPNRGVVRQTMMPYYKPLSRLNSHYQQLLVLTKMPSSPTTE